MDKHILAERPLTDLIEVHSEALLLKAAVVRPSQKTVDRGLRLTDPHSFIPWATIGWATLNVCN